MIIDKIIQFIQNINLIIWLDVVWVDLSIAKNDIIKNRISIEFHHKGVSAWHDELYVIKKTGVRTQWIKHSILAIAPVISDL